MMSLALRTWLTVWLSEATLSTREASRLPEDTLRSSTTRLPRGHVLHDGHRLAGFSADLAHHAAQDGPSDATNGQQRQQPYGQVPYDGAAHQAVQIVWCTGPIRPSSSSNRP